MSHNIDVGFAYLIVQLGVTFLGVLFLIFAHFYNKKKND